MPKHYHIVSRTPGKWKLQRFHSEIREEVLHYIDRNLAGAGTIIFTDKPITVLQRMNADSTMRDGRLVK